MRPTVLIVDDHAGFHTSARAIPRTVEAHVKQIFLKLRLGANPESHRRVLAVLAYLSTGT